MKISKNLLAGVAVTTVAAGSIIGIGAASAHGGFGNGDNVASEVAQKFNLNEEEVKQFFEDKHQERETEMEAKRSERLQALVDAGTITADQKTALEAKSEEMHTLRESFRDQDLTREQMHDKMKEARDSFKTWANEQGIDLEAIRPEGRQMRHGQ